MNIVAPGWVLVSYQLTMEHPSTGSSNVEGSSDTTPVDCSEAEGVNFIKYKNAKMTSTLFVNIGINSFRSSVE